MDNEKRMKDLQHIVSIINSILMVITVALELFAYNALRHAILSSCVLLLTTVELIFDGILKDRKKITQRGKWYVLWFINLILCLLML